MLILHPAMHAVHVLTHAHSVSVVTRMLANAVCLCFVQFDYLTASCMAAKHLLLLQSARCAKARVLEMHQSCTAFRRNGSAKNDFFVGIVLADLAAKVGHLRLHTRHGIVAIASVVCITSRARQGLSFDTQKKYIWTNSG
jgi:hypothetical protein